MADFATGFLHGLKTLLRFGAVAMLIAGVTALAQPKKERLPGTPPPVPTATPSVNHPSVDPGFVDRTNIPPDPEVVERVQAKGLQYRPGGPLLRTNRREVRSLLEITPFRHNLANMPATLPPNDPLLPPSSPLVGFETQDFDDNATVNSGFVFIPPDPMGAAGPDHVVVINNVAIQGFDKTGTPLPGLPLTSLNTFFGPPADPPGTGASFLFDPKTRYDQFSNRFVAIALELTSSGVNPSGGDPGNESTIFVAGTATGDPGATWNVQSVDAKLSGTASGGFTDRDMWCDYPGLAVDEEAIYVSCNYFNFSDPSIGGIFFWETRVWVFDKTALYSGSPTAPILYDIAGTAGVTGACDFTLQPAHPHSDPGSTTATASGGPPIGTPIGTWFTAYSGCSDGSTDYLLTIRLDDPLGASPGATAWFPWFGSALCPNTGSPGFCSWGGTSPQLGSTTEINSNDPRTLDSEWRASSPGDIWTTATVNASSEPGEASALWAKMNSGTLESSDSGTAPSITAFGTVGGEDIDGAGEVHTYFPAISLNNDCVAVGFSASSSAIYAGAFWVSLTGTPAAPGPPGATETVRAGDDSYVRTFGGSRNRWGDYTATVLDYDSEGEGLGFWIFNEYAQVPSGTGSDNGEWGQYAVLDECPSALPIELGAFSGVIDNSDVLLAWNTYSEEGNAGFEIEHKADLGFRSIGWVDGNGTSASEHRYSYRVHDLDPGLHTFRLKQFDINGAVNYSPEVEVMVEVPNRYLVTDAYPNPFNPRTQFTVMVKETQEVRVEVFNSLGQLVTTLYDGSLAANSRHRFTFDSNGLPSGIYLYRVVGEHFVSEAKRVSLLK